MVHLQRSCCGCWEASVWEMGFACHSGHVLQYLESCAGQWSVQWGVRCASVCNQGCFLIPLLFFLVLEAFLCEFCTGVPWQLLYAHDLVLIADMLAECISKPNFGKAGMESKAINMKKTDFLVRSVGLDVPKTYGKHSCAVCRSTVKLHRVLSHCTGVQRHYRSIEGRRKLRLPQVQISACRRQTRD